jgi:hypothetical protein
MIADDTDAIRESLKKLAQAKVQGQAEAARKAATDDSKAKPPKQRVLFDEPGAPFRGFFLEETEQGKPNATFDADAWDEWDHVTLNSGFAEVG